MAVVNRVTKRPIRGKAEFFRPGPLPLFGRDIQDEQLVGTVHPSVDTKVNWLKGIIVTIADETIEFDKAYFSLTSVCG
jgi:hypothetical protein